MKHQPRRFQIAYLANNTHKYNMYSCTCYNKKACDLMLKMYRFEPAANSDKWIL